MQAYLNKFKIRNNTFGSRITCCKWIIQNLRMDFESSLITLSNLRYKTLIEKIIQALFIRLCTKRQTLFKKLRTTGSYSTLIYRFTSFSGKIRRYRLLEVERRLIDHKSLSDVYASRAKLQIIKHSGTFPRNLASKILCHIKFQYHIHYSEENI